MISLESDRMMTPLEEFAHESNLISHQVGDALSFAVSLDGKREAVDFMSYERSTECYDLVFMLGEIFHKCSGKSRVSYTYSEVIDRLDLISERMRFIFTEYSRVRLTPVNISNMMGIRVRLYA